MKTTLIVLLSLVFSLGLSGCGSNQEASSVVESFFESFEKGDFDELDEFVVDGIGTSGDEETDEYILTFLERSSERLELVEIGEPVESGDGYEVQVLVKAPDTYEARKAAVGDMLPMAGMLDYSSEDDFERDFYIGLLEKTIFEKMKEVELIEVDSTLYLEEQEGKLKIVPNEGLFNVLLPNIREELKDSDF